LENKASPKQSTVSFASPGMTRIQTVVIPGEAFFAVKEWKSLIYRALLDKSDFA
jgi:hypothetical protein